jgi:hypothetical protein
MIVVLFIVTIFTLIYVLRPKIVLVTFADTKYAQTLDRIKNEALALDLFDDVNALSENDLDKEFSEKHSEFISNNQRGYGYWIWKPQVIKQVLERVPENSIILYCDAGCSVHNREEIVKLFKTVDYTGIVAFQWDHDKESSWSKIDTINRIFPEGSDTPQIIATAVIFRKCKTSQKFVNDWLKYCEDYHLVDDSESYDLNPDNFREHRHDQSIFSLLCKKYNVKTIPNTLDTGSGPIKASRIKY